MLQIPPEILRTVFTLIREELGLRILVDLSSVCKAWRDIAQPVLWSHVVLNNNTLPDFIESHANATDKLKTVRSLTLHIQVITLTLPRSQYDSDTLESYESHGCPKSQTLHRSIERFSNLISPKLASLESFSFFVNAPSVDEEVIPADDGFWLEPAILGRLLRSLPASCTSLELETSGTDWSPRLDSHHLCPDIRYILPRLRHIKLRIYSLCSQILSQSPTDSDDRHEDPNLRQLQPRDSANLVQANFLSTLSICEYSRIKAGRGFMSCPELRFRLDHGVKPHQLAGSSDFESKPLLLASNLAFAYKTGRFPVATKLEVVELKWSWSDTWGGEYEDEWLDMTDQEQQRAELYGDVILIRDCVENKTYPMPRRYIADGMTGLYDKSDTCVIGAKDDLERHAENTIWKETIYGARMPFGANTTLAGATPRPPPVLLTRKEWRQKSKKGMISWRREEGRPGVKIRRVIPLDGVDVDFDHSMMPLLPARGDPILGDDRVSQVAN